MACNSDYECFKIVTDIGSTSFLSELENNLKYYLDWALLSIGAWTDIERPTTDVYGGESHILRYVHDNSYTDGQVWQSVKKDWVWEQGVDFNDGQSLKNPINISTSGVFVDDIQVTTGFHINYPLGRIIFDTAKSTSSDVQLDYSYRTVQVYVADNASWWREAQIQSVRADSTHFTQDERTGDWSIGGNHRVQLPAIIVESVPRGRAHGYELGSAGVRMEQDVLFHVLADDRSMRNKLVSALQLQVDKVIWLFDSDTIASGTTFPIDYRGERVNNTVYTDLVSETGYRWKKCMLQNTQVSDLEMLNPRLYGGVVRTTCEVIFSSI